MRLSGRVRTLERRSGVNAACPACLDKGVCGTAMRINGVEHARHGGCPRCGRFGTIKVIVLECDTEEEAEAVRRMWS